MKVIIDGVDYVKSIPPPEGLGFDQALSLRIDSDAGDNISIREYLYMQLLTLWKEQDHFSGKRPFGNSGWVYEIYEPLARAGFIEVKKIDGYDGEDLEFNFNWTDDEVKIAQEYVLKLINYMCFSSPCIF